MLKGNTRSSFRLMVNIFSLAMMCSVAWGGSSWLAAEDLLPEVLRSSAWRSMRSIFMFRIGTTLNVSGTVGASLDALCGGAGL
jgi:hypothetical protein